MFDLIKNNKKNILPVIPDDIKEVFKNVLRGKIAIREEEVNTYIKEKMDIKDERLKDVIITFEKETIVVTADVQPQKLLPVIKVDVTFELQDWQFDKEKHYLKFRLVKEPSFNLNGKLTQYLSGVVSLIINKMINDKIYEKLFLKYEYIEYKDNDITFNLDDHTNMRLLLNKEFSIRGKIIKPFDYIKINAILIKKGNIIICPKLTKSQLLKDFV